MRASGQSVVGDTEGPSFANIAVHFLSPQVTDTLKLAGLHPIEGTNFFADAPCPKL
jgi:hypothetical protein